MLATIGKPLPDHIAGHESASGTSRTNELSAVEWSAFGPRADKARFWPVHGLSANDPKRTLAVHCGNGFDAGLAPIKLRA